MKWIFKGQRFSRILAMALVMCSITLLGTPPAESRQFGDLCNDCHKMPPLDSAYRNISTGGFKGNHATHNPPSVAPRAVCEKCHSGSAGYFTDHRNGFVNLTSNINNSPHPSHATYNKPRFFNQTSNPVLQTCSNINCHFETVTPMWGRTPFNDSADCSACHTVPGSSSSHVKHDTYFPFTSNGCVKCHPDYKTTLKFSHATSAGHAGRGIKVVPGEGAYSGTGLNFLPSQSGSRTFGNCSNSYCHSNGTSVSTGSIPENTSPAWTSGSLACNGCHGYPPTYAKDSPKANSHPIHVTHSITDCSICHYETTTTGNSITDKTKHVNKSYNLQAKPGYAFTYTYSPAGGSCASNLCHSNAQWGSGSAGGINCIECHGHSAGYEYESGKYSNGRGSWRTHATHTQNDGGNAKGPNINCDGCHDTNSFPFFKSGIDSNNDGKYNLAETDVCNTCHSPGGTYDGVNNATYGAKANWKFSIYSSGQIRAGKEKWCASCHDESASVISGVTAPNVVGYESGEDATYNYGTGWGYYKTGHGLPTTSTLPAGGGAVNGPGRSCTDCHNASSGHLDGNMRTFECASGTGGACTTQYQSGYRLKSINGSAPMQMPPNGVNEASFKLCFSCHTNTDAWLTNNRAGTNFYQEGSSRNDHYYHLTAPAKSAEHDWDGAFEGWLSCITCHNVHGSKNPAMIRSEELTGVPSMSVRYGNAGSTHTAGQIEPAPNDITLVESTKLTMRGNLASNYCQHCHGTGTAILTVSRTPANIPATPPVLGWVGIPGYESDGVNPSTGNSGDTFTFRVKYTDINQDAPTKVQLWIDLDNNGDYNGVGEKIDMQQAFVELDPYTPYSRGVDYVTTKVISKSSPAGNSLKYKFHAESGADVATGAPTNEQTLNIQNAPPTLNWTGEVNYTSDGVNPDRGPKDGIYAFRVKYVDDDGDACPTSGSADIQVWIDLNGDLVYDADEKFNLTDVDPGDADCTTAGGGKLYYLDKNLPNTSGSDKVYTYRFYAFDGTSAATGSPVSGGTVTVAGTTNNPPYLAWNSGTCRPQGAMPPRSTTSSRINFSVKYFDEDNQYPASDSSAIQVWVDLDKSGTYSAGEKFNLVEDAPADTNCTAAGGGKTYSVSVVPTTVANGITYEFHATDGVDNAAGAPVSGGTIDVVAADYVVKQDGTEDFTTISAAITAVGATNNKTILVYNGTYNENPAITQDPLNMVSACGAIDTIISHTNDPVVHFNLSVGSVLDGFTVTGGSGVGIKSTGNNFNGLTSRPTIKNSIIHSNGGRGIHGYRSTVTITDSEIYGNLGGGVSSYAGSITNTTIRNNSVTGNGGGISTDAGDKGSFTLTNVVIKDNTATGNGGGIYCQNSSGTYAPSYSKVTLSGNTSGGSGGGGYFTYCNPTFTNSLVADNSAPGGGGIGLGIWASAWFVSSSIANNNATAGNGGGYASSDGAINLANSIVWGNRASGTGHIGSFTSTGVKTVYLYDSIIENNCDTNITDDGYFSVSSTVSVIDGGGNDDADPNFVDANNADKTKRDYHVQAPSIAIDNAGNASGKGIPADDLDGNSRPSGEEDIGAYETPDL